MLYGSNEHDNELPSGIGDVVEQENAEQEDTDQEDMEQRGVEEEGAEEEGTEEKGMEEEGAEEEDTEQEDGTAATSGAAVSSGAIVSFGTTLTPGAVATSGAVSALDLLSEHDDWPRWFVDGINHLQSISKSGSWATLIGSIVKLERVLGAVSKHDLTDLLQS